MIEIEIRKWSELSDLAREFGGRRWLFRGVGWYDYGLVPKIGRTQPVRQRKKNYIPKTSSAILSATDLDAWEVVNRPIYSAGLEQSMFDEFQRLALPHLLQEPRTTLEWLIVAQHHGLPTRLLDWTESPLIAAYFAVRNGVGGVPSTGKDHLPFEVFDKHNRAAIYGVPFESLEIGIGSTGQDLFRITDEDPRVILPAHITSRVTVQKSVLTYHFNPWTDWSSSKVRKWILPLLPILSLAPPDPPWLEILDACGINEATLFPGLDGISSYVERRQTVSLIWGARDRAIEKL